MPKALIVDDSQENLYYLRTLLIANGYLVEEAKNGAEGLARARSAAPDLMIADVLMPVMDGFALCAAWRSDPQLAHIPFVFYTGTYTDPKDEELALNLGADLFLVKPMEPAALIEAIRGLLDKHAARQLVRRKSPTDQEPALLRNYNAALIRKLEDKVGQLEVTEQRMHSYLDATAQGIVGIASDGRIGMVNRTLQEMFGFDRAEMIGQPLEMLLPERFRAVHSEHRASYFSAPRKRMMGSGLELVGRRKDGTEFPIDVSLRFIQKEGIAFGLVSDISGLRHAEQERKQAEELLRASEERFRTIFENAGIGAALVDWQGYPIKSNPALQRMLGFTEEELRNRVFTEFTHPDDINLDWTLYGELIAGKRDKYHIEKRYITKNGRVVWGNLIVSQVKNKDGSLAEYMVGMVEDITERKRVEQELRDAHTELTGELEERTRAEAEIARLSERLIKAEEEERTRIARELHDHLSQQIAALGIALSNIKRQIPATKREARDQAGRAYDMLLAIGEGIRNLSHELHPAILEHSGIVAALESYCAELKSLTRVNATVRAEGQFNDLHPSVQLGIYRIAQEALQNVCKHSGVKEASIYLATDGERVQLRVSDQGVGFDASKRSKETGLGLVSMRERARLLGARFTVESSVGHGTTIIADIPVDSVAMGKNDTKEA